MKTKLLILSMLVISLFAFSGCTKTVDCKEAISVKFRGISGYADTIAYQVDDKFSEYLSDITVEYSPKDNLKNGDTVTVTVKSTSENIKLKNTTFKVTVSGLDEAEIVDVSKCLELKFNGVNGNGYFCDSKFNENYFYIGYEDKYQDLFKYVNINITPNIYLSNGDTVHVKVEQLDNSAIDNLQYLNTEFDYTVSGLVDGIEINPFEYIEVNLTQLFSTYIFQYKFNDSCPEVIKNNIIIKNENGKDPAHERYNIGDKIKVKLIVFCDTQYNSKIDMGIKNIADAGYIITQFEKEYTVE